MLLYDGLISPSPRRARMFVAEKGVKIETQMIDMADREHFSPEFLAVNPRATLPVLVTDEGYALTENNGIAVYLEGKFPDPPLMGKDAEEKGAVAMWNTICELHGFMPTGEYLRNSNPRYDGRAVTGPVKFDRIPELAERARQRVDIFFETLEGRLKNSSYLASENFTMADITGFIVCDFAKMIKISIPESCPATQAWFDTIQKRPSANL